MIEAPMGDARFFARSGPHALADIATAAVGTAPAIERMFVGVAPLQSAGQDEVSFLDNRRYARALEHTTAGAVIVHPQMQARVPNGSIAIVTASTYEGWARVAALFHPMPPPHPGIHPTALVDSGCAGRRFRRDRSLRGNRGPRRDRAWLPHRVICIHRRRRHPRPRLPYRRSCQPQSRLARVAGLHLSRAPGSVRRGSASPQRRPASSASRNLAAWSWKTTWKSAPTPQSIADRRVILSSVLGRASITWCRLATMFGLAAAA